MSPQLATQDVLTQSGLSAPQAGAIVGAVEIEISKLQETLAGQFALLATKATLQAEMYQIRAEMRIMRLELEMLIAKEVGRLEALLHSVESRVICWTFAFIMGQTAVLLGAGYFLVTQLQK